MRFLPDVSWWWGKGSSKQPTQNEISSNLQMFYLTLLCFGFVFLNFYLYFNTSDFVFLWIVFVCAHVCATCVFFYFAVACLEIFACSFVCLFAF